MTMIERNDPLITAAMEQAGVVELQGCGDPYARHDELARDVFAAMLNAAPELRERLVSQAESAAAS